MKLLVFGGAFDPPHKGHYELLSDAVEELNPDLALVIPSKLSPHKQSSKTAFRHRKRMCRVFLSCDKCVRVSSIEFFMHGASYTIRTVRALKKRYRDAEIYLLVGTDMLDTFDKWREYKALLRECIIVAGGRKSGDNALLQKAKSELEAEGGTIILLDHSVLEISSTEIRNALSSGEHTGMLFDETAEYVRKHGLYKKQ